MMKNNSKHNYELTLICIKCDIKVLIIKDNPIRLWHSIKLKKWIDMPDLESPNGSIFGKCYACITKETNLKRSMKKMIDNAYNESSVDD